VGQVAENIGDRPVISLSKAILALGQHFQHGEAFLGLFILDKILKNRFGFPILGDNHGLPAINDLSDDF